MPDGAPGVYNDRERRAMCGLAGIILLGDRGKRISEQTIGAVQRMHSSPSLRRRGPDHRSSSEIRTAQGALALLVATRLAITDRDNPAANMPFYSPDGELAVVYNGEIYNHRALRRELAACHRFRTHCDTEVLLAAYSRWGERMFSRLEGMYAFCLVDRRRRRSLIAVDHAGQK